MEEDSIAAGYKDAMSDLKEGWISPSWGSAKNIVEAARSQAGGGDDYWQGYAQALTDKGLSWQS